MNKKQKMDKNEMDKNKKCVWWGTYFFIVIGN
uniref:Uncharacterized protein n=1 Tax=viral metagenome TaxID=1070528 RepID=A0A6C0LU54_9ZZZZ